jgi:hypothetical protein
MSSAWSSCTTRTTGVLYDVIDDPDGRRKGDQIVCDCGCEFFDMQMHSKRGK